MVSRIQPPRAFRARSSWGAQIGQKLSFHPNRSKSRHACSGAGLSHAAQRTILDVYPYDLAFALAANIGILGNKNILNVVGGYISLEGHFAFDGAAEKEIKNELKKAGLPSMYCLKTRTTSSAVTLE